MNPHKKTSHESVERLTENIIHRTGIRPYSLHHTIVKEEDSSALYLHCHPEAELFFLEEGSISFEVENRCYHLTAGEGIFIPPMLTHSAQKYNTMTCSFYAIVFAVDMLEECLPPYCQSYFATLHDHRPDAVYPISHDPRHKELSALLPGLFRHYEENLSTCELTITGLLLQIWQELYNLHFFRLSEKKTYSLIQSELQAGMEFMQNHFAESLALSDIASHTGLSEGHFCRCFKAYTGIPPFTYLNKIRIIKSCEYLSDSNKKITDIAALCGFNNISYFNRIFRKVMQVAPSEYRKNSFRY